MFRTALSVSARQCRPQPPRLLSTGVGRPRFLGSSPSARLAAASSTKGYHVLPVATARGICIRPQGICTVHRFLSSNHADHNRAVVLYDELVEIIEAPEKNFVLVDVREPHEVSEGKILDAIELPLGLVHEALTEMDSEDFSHNFKATKPDVNQENVIIYCRAGVRAEHARRLFEEAGYKDARNFSGSMLEWNAKHKLPVPPTC